MADTAMVNAIKDLTRAVKDQTRAIEKQLKLLEVMNNNYVAAYSKQVEDAEKLPAHD